METAIHPEWPAPPPVRAVSTLRGVTPDKAWRLFEVPGQPRWLSQMHGTDVVCADENWTTVQADACVAFAPRRACVLRTADCLPVLLCDESATRVGAAHCGWRGLASGVIEASVHALRRGGAEKVEPDALMAWIGPGIGAAEYEVGVDVFRAITTGMPDAARFFARRDSNHWLLDLAALARHQLGRLGISRVYGGHWCTFSDPRRFHSWRRDGGKARHATFIWLDPGG